MKRHIIKDIILALLPLSLFLAYAVPGAGLRLQSQMYFYSPVYMITYNIFVPAIVGGLLCVAVIYAWKNRASTVFISLFCGAFIMNMFFVLSSLDVVVFIGRLRLGMTALYGGVAGVELAGVIDGAYIVMFWVSLVSYIKLKRMELK